MALTFVGVELERVAVGLGRLLVLAEPEVRVAEHDARLDAAAAIDGLRRRANRLGVVLLLERDLGQPDQRRPAVALRLGELLEDRPRLGEPLGAEEPLAVVEQALVVGRRRPDASRGLGLRRRVGVVRTVVLVGGRGLVVILGAPPCSAAAASAAALSDGRAMPPPPAPWPLRRPSPPPPPLAVDSATAAAAAASRACRAWIDELATR